jgi:hypothetical protein
VSGDGNATHPPARHPPEPDPAVLVHDHSEPLEVLAVMVGLIAAGADELDAARRSGLTTRTRHGISSEEGRLGGKPGGEAGRGKSGGGAGVSASPLLLGKPRFDIGAPEVDPPSCTVSAGSLAPVAEPSQRVYGSPGDGGYLVDK